MKNILYKSLNLNDFLGVTKEKIEWKFLLNFVLSVFLVSAVSIVFKKNINVFQTFMVALINGILLLVGIILTIKYLKIDNVIVISIIIGFICSLTSIFYLDFYYFGMSLLNFFTHFLGHFVTFIFLVFFLKKLNYVVAVFLTYVSKGIALGLFRFIITGKDAFIAPRVILNIIIYSIITALLIYIGSHIFKIKYYTNLKSN